MLFAVITPSRILIIFIIPVFLFFAHVHCQQQKHQSKVFWDLDQPFLTFIYLSAPWPFTTVIRTPKC